MSIYLIMPTIDIIAGARPNFMKIAPIVEALDAGRRNGSPLIDELEVRCSDFRDAA